MMSRVQHLRWRWKGDEEHHVTRPTVERSDLHLLCVIAPAIKTSSHDPARGVRRSRIQISNRPDQVRLAGRAEQADNILVCVRDDDHVFRELDELRVDIKMGVKIIDP